jgi:hypothetical protein
MAEVDLYPDKDQENISKLWNDLNDKIKTKTRSTDDIEEKMLAIRMMYSYIKAQPANPIDRDIYIEKMQQYGEMLKKASEGDNYIDESVAILWNMVDATHEFITTAKLFKSERRATGGLIHERMGD